MGNATLNLMEIRAFVTVARTGSVQAASTLLSLTQPAVSRLVQRLEGDLKAKLFDRSAKPLALTPDGLLALDHGSRVLSCADDMIAAVAATAPRGVLRFGTAHALAALLAEAPLDLLRTAFPDVTLQLTVDWAQPLIARIEGDVLDAALLTLIDEGAPRTGLPARLVREESVCVIGPAHHGAASRLPLASLNEVGWAIQPEGCGYRTALDRASLAAGARKPRIAIETLARDTQLAAVARGAAFCMLPASLAHDIARDGPFTVVGCPDLDLRVSVWFVRRTGRGRLAGALDLLQDTLHDMLKPHDAVAATELSSQQAME